MAINVYDIGKAIRHEPEFTHGEARFLGVMLDHADTLTGRVHYSLQRVAEDLGMDRKIGTRVIAKALTLGYLANVEERRIGTKTIKNVWFAPKPPVRPIAAQWTLTAGRDVAVASEAAQSTVGRETAQDAVGSEAAPSTGLISPSSISPSQQAEATAEKSPFDLAREQLARERQTALHCS